MVAAPWQCRGSGGQRAFVAFLTLCLLLFSVALEDAAPPDGATGLVRAHDNGAVTLRSRTYAKSEHSHRLRKMQRGAPAFERLRRQLLPVPPGDQAEVRQTVYDVTATLADDLLALAATHKEEWLRVALEPSANSEELRMDLAHGDDNFDGAVNAYEAALEVYRDVWRVVGPGEVSAEASAEESMAAGETVALFSPLDQEAVAAGHATVLVALADLYHQRFNDRFAAPTLDACARAHKLLRRAEAWCEQSQEILGAAAAAAGGRHDDERDAAAAEVAETWAFVRVRQGALLVDMFAAGYVLGRGPRDLAAPARAEEGAAPEEDGERTLRLALERATAGLRFYEGAATEPGGGAEARADRREDAADAHKYAGLAHFYLGEWEAAARELDISTGLHEALFRAHYDAGMAQEAVDVAAGLLPTLQNLWESYLNLPGKTEDAMEAFAKHLAFRQYLESPEVFGRPLTNKEEEEDEFYMPDPDADNGVSGDAVSVMHPEDEEDLKNYQDMLSEYLQMLTELPPDGSYYEMEFDYDGSYASHVQHDNLYEGSLRASIGSLQLDYNRVWEARGELEMAVQLLRNDLHRNGGASVAYNEDGDDVEFPVRLELAAALLNLAYAQLALKQWQSALEDFIESMQLYAGGLKEGATPLGHAAPGGEERTGPRGGAGRGARRGPLVGERPVEYGVPILDSNEGGPSEVVSHIELENFPMAENTTAFD